MGAWSGGVVSQHALRQTPPTPVNRMTNRCKNITLPQTSFASGSNLIQIQDSILVGCIPAAWKPYVSQFQLSPLNVTPGVGDRWVSPPDVASMGVGIPEWDGYPTYPMMHMIYLLPTLCGQNDGQTPMKTLPSCNFVGGR